MNKIIRDITASIPEGAIGVDSARGGELKVSELIYADKDKCPKCKADPGKPDGIIFTVEPHKVWKCGTVVCMTFGFSQGLACVGRQRDQLARRCEIQDRLIEACKRRIGLTITAAFKEQAESDIEEIEAELAALDQN